MLYSTRHLQEMRSQFLSISLEQWTLLAFGLLVGGAVWALVNRRIVHRMVNALKERTLKANAIAAVESVIGGTIFLINAGLVYVATTIASFFLFAFAIPGLLIGAWITIPASFE